METASVAVIGYAAGFLLLAGCAGSDRSNPVDPANAPTIIQVQGATFDATQLKVTSSWHWAGFSSGRYRVVRKAPRTGETSASEWSALQTPAASGVSREVAYADESPPTGEYLSYTVEVDDGTRTLAFPLGNVQVSGARLEYIATQLSTMAFDVSWTTAGTEGAVYEVVRTGPDGVHQVVFRTPNAAETGWTDSSVVPGAVFRYRLRTVLPEGSSLGSAVLTAGMFVDAGEWNLFQEEDRRYGFRYEPILGRSSRGSQFVRDDVIAVLREDGQGCQIWAYDSDGRIYGDRGPARLGVAPGALRHGSISFDLLQSGDAVVTLAGVENEDGDVVLRAYTFGSTNARSAFDFGYVRPVIWDPGPWRVPPRSRTVLSNDQGAMIYVAAGREMRIYDGALNELGRVSVDASTVVTDMIVHRDSVWIALEEDGRLLRAPSPLQPGLVVTQPVWEEIPLPPGARPIGLCAVDDVMAVLDAGQEAQVILLRRGDGGFLTRWTVPGLDLRRDGMSSGGVMTMLDELWVWDSWGRVRMYDIHFEG